MLWLHLTLGKSLLTLDPRAGDVMPMLLKVHSKKKKKKEKKKKEKKKEKENVIEEDAEDIN